MKCLLQDSDNKRVGHSISFVDIDETTMHTFAKVGIMKDGQKVGELDNQQFNTYKLKDGESFDFSEFADSEVFNKTSTPIQPMVDRLKKIIDSIKKNNKLEKVIFLTARSDFDDKELFLKTFRSMGIDVDIPNVYVERSGNLKEIDGVANRKKHVILNYLNTGEYTAVRMYDDDDHNLEIFTNLGKEVNAGKFGILKTVKKKFPRTSKLFFYALKVNSDGSITKY